MGLIYAVVSYWGFPIFGGGEWFLYDTMLWAKEAGLDTVWLCFGNPDPKQPDGFPQTEIIQTPHGTVIQIGGGYTDEKLSEWLTNLRPHVVHHQGHCRVSMMRVCKNLNIPFITGLHFWQDSVDLNKSTYNTDIVKNKNFTKLPPTWTSYKRLMYYM